MDWLKYTAIQTLLGICFFLPALILPWPKAQLLFVAAALFFVGRTLFDPNRLLQRLAAAVTFTGIFILAINWAGTLNFGGNWDFLTTNGHVSSTIEFLEQNEFLGFCLVALGLGCAALHVALEKLTMNRSVKPFVQILTIEYHLGTEPQADEINANIIIHNPAADPLVFSSPILRIKGLLPAKLDLKYDILKFDDDVVARGSSESQVRINANSQSDLILRAQPVKGVKTKIIRYLLRFSPAFIWNFEIQLKTRFLQSDDTAIYGNSTVSVIKSAVN